MTKNIFIGLAILAILSETAFAGPFGLSMGMKKSDFKGELEKLGGLNEYRYKTGTVPKEHSAFDYYIVKITPQTGLCHITAVGKNISVNAYGDEAQRAFDSMELKLKKSYGSNTRFDYLRDGSLWDGPRYWMRVLKEEERTLMVLWNKKAGSTLKDNLGAVALSVKGIGLTTGYLRLEYAFTNKYTCDAEVAAEDSAL